MSARKAVLTQLIVTDMDLPLLYGALEEKKKRAKDQILQYRILTLQKKIHHAHSELVRYNNNRNQLTLDLAQGIQEVDEERN